jgi:hypothetical protein
MTVLSLQWLAARPRRWAALPCTSRTARPVHRSYPDPFFADPSAVEDDSRRMTRPGRQS